MKVIAIGGVPGSGKTTLMQAIMTRLGHESQFADGLVRGHYHPQDRVYVLGLYDIGTFKGTDRLSMGVQPAAVKFISTLGPRSSVIFEGDRLFNGKMLQALAAMETLETHVFILTAANAELSRRYEERGSLQSEKFLKSRHTKIAGMIEKAQSMPGIFCHVRDNPTRGSLSDLADEIVSILRCPTR